jgi:uroporphyrinogen decarboxylase
MPNKELLIKTLNHETPEKAPWVPFAGVHAGKLVGYSAREVLTDGDKLFKALMEVNKLYKPNGQPVVFDLQLEAEILGCKLRWADDAPPSVASHPYEGEDMELPSEDLIPKETDGRLPMVLDVMRRMKKAVGDDTLLYGLVCGPFTLAAHLRGNDIFMDMFDDDEYVHNLLDYCTRVAMQVAEYYVKSGMDVIAVVDPLISQISAKHFEEFMTEPFTALFEKIKSMGAYSSFFVCGDATRNMEVMCQTKPDSISIDENVDLLKAKEVTDKYNIAL